MMMMRRRRRRRFALSRRLFSPQQWFMFIGAEVERVHTVVLSSHHASLQLVLVLQLWPCRIGPTSAYDAIRHQGGDARAVAVSDHHHWLGSVPSGDTASSAGAVGHCVRLYSRGHCYSVHLSNAGLHLKHIMVWISDLISWLANSNS